MQVEKLEEIWARFTKLVDRLEDENISKLVEDLGERMLLCPNANRTDSAGCYPGGMIEHALLVTAKMKELNGMAANKATPRSLLITGLFHGLGKIGDLNDPMYVEETSDWHRDKLGQLYKFNDSIDKMSASHRALYILQHYGVKLEKEEWLAIQLSTGLHFEENRFYVGSEPYLAFLLHQAKTMITQGF